MAETRQSRLRDLRASGPDEARALACLPLVRLANVAFIGVGVVCRMEYRAGHAWEHGGAPLSGQTEAIRALPKIAVRDRDL
jgi:hypothetical protein